MIGSGSGYLENFNRRLELADNFHNFYEVWLGLSRAGECETKSASSKVICPKAKLMLKRVTAMVSPFSDRNNDH